MLSKEVAVDIRLIQDAIQSVREKISSKRTRISKSSPARLAAHFQGSTAALMISVTLITRRTTRLTKDISTMNGRVSNYFTLSENMANFRSVGRIHQNKTIPKIQQHVERFVISKIKIIFICFCNFMHPALKKNLVAINHKFAFRMICKNYLIIYL